MDEIFSRIASVPLWLAILMMALLYILIVGGIRTFLRPAMVGNLDPLNIKILIFIGPAILGLVVSPFLIGSISESYYLILIFVALWILVVRVSGKPKKIDLRDEMGANFQATLLLFATLIIIANVTVNMIIPGKIPLLTEGGGFASRFDATQNSRLLTWLTLATAQMPGLIYAVTQNLRIQKFAIFAVALQVIASLLFASKSGILTIVFIFLNSLFIASARNEYERYKKIRRMLIVCVVFVALLVPTYFSIIGFGGESGTGGLLAVRFLSGFDQLIFASQFDLLRHAGLDPLLKTNLIEYQLMPFFKALLSSHYEYNSVGEYVIEYVTGIRVDSPGTYPNSNLILETVFTAGKYLGAVFFLLELGAFYWCRRVALRRPITPVSLVLVQAFIMSPTDFFTSGQDWVTETILALFTVIVALALSQLFSSICRILQNDFVRAGSVP
jgi:hypothetical protein